MIELAITNELLQQQESLFFQEIFCPFFLFLGFGLILFFLFFSSSLKGGGLLGLLLPTGFGLTFIYLFRMAPSLCPPLDRDTPILIVLAFTF